MGFNFDLDVVLHTNLQNSKANIKPNFMRCVKPRKYLANCFSIHLCLLLQPFRVRNQLKRE